MKKAVITGVYGQDGSFLCELLWQKEYHILGISKKKLSANSLRIKEELEGENINVDINYIDIYNYEEVSQFIQQVQPDEIYHMATYHVSSEGKSNGDNIREQEGFNKNVIATANILEACYHYSKHTRIVTAGSCLMYDASETLQQDENTPFQSNSLYGLAKITEHMLVQFYRKRGMFVCTAILYNHESHRRASQYVTKKIVENMIRIKRGDIQSFVLGSLDIEKDWGYAGDYADAMWRMLQIEQPKDFIVATGEVHTIREFIDKCADILEINNWGKYITINDSIINRRIDGQLVGNNSALKQELKWRRSKNFNEMIEEMVTYEMQNNG